MPPENLEDLPYAAMLSPHPGPLSAGESYECAHFDGLALDDPQAPGTRFLECAFTKVSISGGQLRRARFSDVWLSGIRLTAAQFADTSWSDAAILGSVAAGVSAHGSQLRRVTFRHCKLDGVNFRDATLIDVSFDDCLLRGVDFGGATLQRCTFPGSQLRETDFSRATLKSVNLRGAELGLIITPGSLSGAIISTAQLTVVAPLLAEQAGIVVEDAG